MQPITGSNSGRSYQNLTVYIWSDHRFSHTAPLCGRVHATNRIPRPPLARFLGGEFAMLTGILRGIQLQKMRITLSGLVGSRPASAGLDGGFSQYGLAMNSSGLASMGL